ncbi:MAG: hypothetical protein WKG00_16245 [Polyangiaceae bacterium]
MLHFADVDIFSALNASTEEDLEAADFGIVGMSAEGVVEIYNRYESALSGLSAATVIGNHFFTAVAPCTNNYLVAQRFSDEPSLDATIDYVFTLKMRPTKVRLRLLQAPGARRAYLLVDRVGK